MARRKEENKEKTALRTPSVLSFERKLDPSDALFYSGKWEWVDEQGDWKPVSVTEKSVRGTISNRVKAGENPEKLASITNPNLKRLEYAALDAAHDTLRTNFTLRVLGGVGIPASCNNIEYRALLLKKMKEGVEKHGFYELGRRYAHNIAGGRFLWRNRLASEEIRICVSHHVQGQEEVRRWEFNASDFSMSGFDAKNKEIDSLAKIFADTLANPEGFALLNVSSFARMGNGQEVFPSQELVLDRQNKNNGRLLYSVYGIAGQHSQKIGNALRTIDTWYAENAMPIAVEAYGSVTNLGMAFRQPSGKKDFYSLFDAWMLKDAALTEEEFYYVAAMLIRGGVFGSTEKD